MTNLRIGLGEDRHRTAGGGPLQIGGVEVPHNQHLVGHSDADVLLHAATDALLGAAGLPDIGQLFPNTDATNLNRDSGEFLQLAYAQVREAGYQLVNLDAVVCAQKPKLSSYKKVIVQRIADLLDADRSQINFKAKTGEGVGTIGRGEAIEARVVALIEKR